jgi:hypothetical protein
MNDCIITIDGIDYIIVSFVINDHIVVTSSPYATGIAPEPAVDSFDIPAPNYLHGTIKQTSNEITEVMDKTTVYPLIYLNELIIEDFDYDELHPLERTSPLRIFFLETHNGELTEDTKTLVLDPVNNLVDEFIKILRKTPYINKGAFTPGKRTNLSLFGVYQFSKGNVSNYFNDKLTGVELAINLPLSKGLCNNFNQKCKNQ